MDPITKRAFIKSIIIQTIIYIVIGMAITMATLFFASSFGVKGWLDSLMFAGVLLLVFSWMVFIANANFFTTLFYGVKQFISGIIGRQMEMDIIEYRASRKVYGKEIMLVPLSVGLLYILASIILWVFFL